MYLIEIETLALIEFLGEQVPPYAILSHRWCSEELNFKEVFKGRIDRRKEGYRKLIGACRTAIKYKVRHLWMDTCCIDKKSSAELSEAINSMFSWYKNAKICLAYLQDINAAVDLDEAFTASVWFTRAWTLQELLAPGDVAFYNCDWVFIGTKQSRSEAIELITGIPSKALEVHADLGEWSICQRMTWASKRHATRPEDIAYSLMGIFNIHMPLLYGEGSKAFTRLQEEIVRHTTDPTFVLWGFDKKTPQLLASTPAEFQQNEQLHVFMATTSTPFSLTNIGLEITSPTIRYRLGVYGLSVGRNKYEEEVVLLVRKHPWLDAYYKLGVAKLPDELFSRWWQEKKLTILRGSEEQELAELAHYVEKDQAIRSRENGFAVETDPAFPVTPGQYGWRSQDQTVSAFKIEAQWDTSNGPHMLTCTFEDRHPGFAKMTCTTFNSRVLQIEMSFDFDSRPCILISDQASGIRLFNGISNPSILELAEAFKGTMGVISSHRRQLWREVRLWKIIDQESGSAAYLLRSDSPGPCIPWEIVTLSTRLPVELTSSETPVWITLAEPWTSTFTARNIWSLKISRSPPVDPTEILSSVL